MAVQIRLLRSGDDAVLSNVAKDVFDNDVDGRLVNEFLNDPRHHLAVAIEDGCVVGMASAVHYVHPDKPSEIWINEVGVSPAHRSRGLGKMLLSAILQAGRELGCREAWVLTEQQNLPARRLYASLAGIEAPDLVMFTFRLAEEDRPLPTSE